jgi:hypothetical protein
MMLCFERPRIRPLALSVAGCDVEAKVGLLLFCDGGGFGLSWTFLSWDAQGGTEREAWNADCGSANGPLLLGVLLEGEGRGEEPVKPVAELVSDAQ